MFFSFQFNLLISVHKKYKMSTRKRKHKDVRDGSGRFLLGICGCVCHDNWSFDKLFDVRKISKNNTFGKTNISEMRSQGYQSRGDLLCTACYAIFKDKT